ncbi:demethylmenaquinone methyltransferase [Pseudonocardia lacus]|uniref:demethylmenaquinone methyltransferase n=1 Tax=Pseudonocardia lacus TaxID=2835865 RepID=UPI001BDBEEA3|nr:demethylmenaquinone methyltransferase [Pseudonocardia lacus]
MTRAGLDRNPHDVAAMFDGVARRYDLTNTVLTGGLDRRWRALTRESLRVGPGDRVLDLAAGTGVSSAEIGRSGAWCVAADFSLGMLRAGAWRGVPMAAADALHLPFADAAFDAVCISFGLRNVVDIDRALAEMARVARPGARLVVCEFSQPVWAPFRAAFHTGLSTVLPAVAARVSSNPRAYSYLGESIRSWDSQPELARRIGAAGWREVAWRNLVGGAVALHRGVR